MKYLIYDWLGGNQKLFEQLNYILNLGICPYVFNIVSKPFQILMFSLYFTLILAYKSYYLNKVNFQYSTYLKEFKQLIRIGFVYISLGAAYTIMKYGINLPRPYCSLKHFASIMDFSNVRCLSSFPSAHTAIAVMICYLCFPYLSFIQKFLASFIVIIAGLSRIALAMHYPADIIYSIIIAYIICAASDKIITSSFIQKNIVLPVANCFFNILKKYFIKK